MTCWPVSRQFHGQAKINDDTCAVSLHQNISAVQIPVRNGGLVQVWMEGGRRGGKGWQRIRGSGEDTRQKKWANLLFIKHLSRYSTPRIPCFPRHDTLKPDIQILWHLQMHDNIQKIPSYSFPFPSLLNVQ